MIDLILGDDGVESPQKLFALVSEHFCKCSNTGEDVHKEGSRCGCKRLVGEWDHLYPLGEVLDADENPFVVFFRLWQGNYKLHTLSVAHSSDRQRLRFKLAFQSSKP